MAGWPALRGEHCRAQSRWQACGSQHTCWLSGVCVSAGCHAVGGEISWDPLLPLALPFDHLPCPCKPPSHVQVQAQHGGHKTLVQAPNGGGKASETGDVALAPAGGGSQRPARRGCLPPVLLSAGQACPLPGLCIPSHQPAATLPLAHEDSRCGPFLCHGVQQRFDPQRTVGGTH